MMIVVEVDVVDGDWKTGNGDGLQQTTFDGETMFFVVKVVVVEVLEQSFGVVLFTGEILPLLAPPPPPAGSCEK